MISPSVTRERVVVTGLGVIAALGNNHQDFWKRLSAGESGITPISSIECSDLYFKNGAEVKDFDSEAYFEPKQLGYLDRFAQFGLIAAKEAVLDSRLTRDELANSQSAIVTGSCMGGKITEDEAYYRLYHHGSKRANPITIPKAMANAAASQIALMFGITGPTYTVSTACSSSTHAIGQAFWLIRHGIVARAIAGGSEAPFSRGQLKAWEGLRVMSNDTCRPFSKMRRGIILGEGGAMLVLESLTHALARQAPIYAEIIGFGMSADAAHLVDPDSTGQVQAMSAALNDAAIKPEAINYINAHGTGTLLNDKVEAESIRSIFGTDNNYFVSATKAAHGHLLGAAGAIETIATVLAIKNNIIPPTLNFLEHDPDCDIPLVSNQSRRCQINYALCSSFAFGGLNAILALRRYN